MWFLFGCAPLQGPDYGVYDRAEAFNRASYAFTDAIDRTVLAPTARGYQRIAPDWLERGIANVFVNLRHIPSSANGLLQGKPKAAGTDLARLLINSTIGIGGFFDVASRWDLRFSEEDFGQTLAVWGVKNSRYVFVPFLGPTTLRDLPAVVVRSITPRLVFGSDYHWGWSALDLVSVRAGALSASDVRDASALDPYAFTRDAYYQRRKFLIYDGELPDDDLFDEFDDEDF